MNSSLSNFIIKLKSVSIQDPTAQFSHTLSLPDNPISKRKPSPKHQEYSRR